MIGYEEVEGIIESFPASVRDSIPMIVEEAHGAFSCVDYKGRSLDLKMKVADFILGECADRGFEPEHCKFTLLSASLDFKAYEMNILVTEGLSLKRRSLSSGRKATLTVSLFDMWN